MLSSHLNGPLFVESDVTSETTPFNTRRTWSHLLIDAFRHSLDGFSADAQENLKELIDAVNEQNELEHTAKQFRNLSKLILFGSNAAFILQALASVCSCTPGPEVEHVIASPPPIVKARAHRFNNIHFRPRLYVLRYYTD